MKQFLIIEMNSTVKRMDQTEIILGLRTSLLNNNRTVISNHLRDSDLSPVSFINGIEIYLPFRELRQGRYQARQKDYYINGYGFIEYTSVLDYMPLERSFYIERILKSPSTNFFELLSESIIREEQSKMFEFFSGTFRFGQLVQIVNGNFSNMPARVISFDEEENIYQVIVATRSKTWKLKIPPDHLRVRDEDLIVVDDFIEDDQ